MTQKDLIKELQAVVDEMERLLPDFLVLHRQTMVWFLAWLILLVASLKWSQLVFVSLIALVLSQIWQYRTGKIDRKIKKLTNKGDAITMAIVILKGGKK